MRRWSLACFVLALGAACSSTVVATETHGILDEDGDAFAHQETKIWALHLFCSAGLPLWEDASMGNAVDEFTAFAAAHGNRHARLTDSETTTWWWVLFPISLVLTPISAEVSGDVKP